MSNLLTQKGKTVCENIVKSGDSINAKRAKALLLIDGGDTHAQAAQSSTLSLGQVRYVLAKYRSIGLAFFPAEFSVEKEETSPIVNTQTTNKEEPIVEEIPKVIIKTKKKKKERSDKKSKKTDSVKVKKDAKKKSKKDAKVSKKKNNPTLTPIFYFGSKYFG